MTDQSNPEAPDTLLSVQTEHPAAIEIRAISPDGYPITLALRDQDTQRLLDRTEKAMAWLKERGYRPPSPAAPKPKPKSAPTTPATPPPTGQLSFTPDES